MWVMTFKSLPTLRLCGGSCSKDKTSAIGGCGVFQQFRSLPRATTTMPAQHSSSTRATSSSGSFVEGSSSHNQHRFPSARDDLARPYPSAHDVYHRSNVHNPDNDEFADLRLSDFFIT